MPVFVGFLRGINLGSLRQFNPKQIVAACERAGLTDVATHINSGNVRVRTMLRSTAKVETLLEQAFADDRGFEVPTVVLTLTQLARVVADADAVRAELGDLDPATRHYVSLLKTEPDADAIRALEAKSAAGEHAVVRHRAVHLLLEQGYHQAKLTNTVVEKLLGPATNRNVTVLRALTEKWC